MDCLFCKIVKGDIPCFKVYEDEKHIAFLDIDPCVDGHALVIPKKHSNAFTEMPPEDAGALFEAVNKVSNQLMDKLGCSGLTIGVNTYASAGQTVMHTHVHIFPRIAGDGGGTTHSIIRAAKSSDMAYIQNLCQKINEK
ncbi:MAG: HIT family protein [Methanimicrococcus sp.]|nr:HIT family protein [Methanimicrococcus sp.]